MLNFVSRLSVNVKSPMHAHHRAAPLSGALFRAEHVGGLGVRHRVWLHCCHGNRVNPPQPAVRIWCGGTQSTSNDSVCAGRLTKILQTCMQSSPLPLCLYVTLIQANPKTCNSPDILYHFL